MRYFRALWVLVSVWVTKAQQRGVVKSSNWSDSIRNKKLFRVFIQILSQIRQLHVKNCQKWRVLKESTLKAFLLTESFPHFILF